MSDATQGPAAQGRPAPSRGPADIERDIEQTRARLAMNVEALAAKLSPASLAHQAQDSARRQVIDEQGRLRAGRAAALAGALVGVIAVVVLRRRARG